MVQVQELRRRTKHEGVEGIISEWDNVRVSYFHHRVDRKGLSEKPREEREMACQVQWSSDRSVSDIPKNRKPGQSC